jgi:hypothetical protein
LVVQVTRFRPSTKVTGLEPQVHLKAAELHSNRGPGHRSVTRLGAKSIWKQMEAIGNLYAATGIYHLKNLFTIDNDVFLMLFDVFCCQIGEK